MQSFVFVVIASYAGFCLLLYVLQDRLIFFPQPAHVGKMMLAPGWTTEPVAFTSHDGFTLRGDLVRPPGGPAPLVIYFGGNAEEISHLAQYADRYGGAALLLVNYRGYGGNPGKPGEHALVADAMAIFDQARTLANIRKDEIIVHGRSLGTGVAVALSSKRALKQLILTTPYDSFAAIAASHYPVIPVRLLLRHRFDSLALAPSANIRTLFLVGLQDNITPAANARTLFDAWLGPKQWREFAESGHNDIAETPGYWDTIAAFLAPAASGTAPK